MPNFSIDRRRLATFCRDNGIRRLALFGSALREDFGPNSDVDVLVEFERGRTPVLRFFSIQEELGRMFNRRVDLHTRVTQSVLPRRGRGGSRGSMSRRDPAASLRQMRDHAREVIGFARDRKRSDLDSDRLLALALVRLLEIIGEAAARVAADHQARMPAIPWRSIIGLRNRLIHGDDEVDNDILRQIVTQDIPALEFESARSLPTNPA